MDFKSTLRYKFGMISDIIVFGLMMIFFIVSDTGTSYVDEYGYRNYKELLVLGYLAWMYAVSALSIITTVVSGELKQGTFYKKMNAKYPLQFLLAGKFISGVLLQTVITIVLIVIARLFFEIEIAISLMLILTIIISTMGMYGIGMVIGGLATLVKRTGSVLFIIQTGLLFVTDTIPASNSVLSVTGVLPLTLCNIAMKQVVSGQVFITTMFKLIISSLVCLVIGMVSFDYFIKRAKKRGNLLFY